MTGEETIDALARTLDALDDHLRSSDATARRSERNRLSMLHLHALAACYIGPLFTLIGEESRRGAAWAVIRLIPGSTTSLGVLLTAGGVVLGVATWRRALVWEMAGLCVLLSWYLIVAVSFGLGAAGWYLRWDWVDGSRPAPYAHGIYLHLFTIMIVHLGTLAKIRRARRKAAR
ncbi:hypothetical protein FHR83_006726 [Actinoplanes campanulatus]|uniref:Uncharacterized protein n=1 Tax=Actinoplanes campanulatus TaxID=113559 RepID=A0A7W5AMY0_9ACTN|nr:hypothetical protein [Actinoplanes campanulatus]MBB3099020.1 hypothetical protein [Actinoplanes campanulatus]GGN39396.1 hypothetical protein GCM10010109_67300 [Actinoplanes campanulatus]GID40179.1 hypothetical protein Aca09nite_66850 [Actinoplanes campanulatus]